ncbi:MAG: hypothetical protein QW165_02920 [Candidatus Woesearchaeota archaeon]
MGLFGFGKKRREELPLPPPPSPPELPPLLKGDIEEIRPPEAPSAIPEIPPMEEHEEKLPELPPALPAPMPAMAPAEEKEARVFDKTVQPEAEEPIREVVRTIPKPAFVAVEDYRRIINDTNTIRAKLMDAENFVRRLGDLKNEEERSFERWRTLLEDVEKKMNYVDQLIAKAG